MKRFKQGERYARYKSEKQHSKDRSASSGDERDLVWPVTDR